MRLTRQQVREAEQLLNEGQSIQQLAYRYSVHETTMRKVMRNYERYGDSLFTMYPTDRLEDASS